MTQENGSSGATNVADARGLARRSEALAPREASGRTSAFLDEFFRAVSAKAPGAPSDRSGAGPSGFLSGSLPASARASPGWGLVCSRSRGCATEVVLWAMPRSMRKYSFCGLNYPAPRTSRSAQSFELESPATLGWRHPLLLLPFDWRDWSRSELRAVLAHELAHVVRGDFLTGLIAQVSVAIHFYHPLAHWLARRMRLEQELAADAWAPRSPAAARPI